MCEHIQALVVRKSFHLFFQQFHFERNVICSVVFDLCTGIAEVMGSNSVESPEFFRFMRQLLKLSSKCEDHIFIKFHFGTKCVFIFKVGRGQAVEQFTAETVAFHPHWVHSEKVLILLFDSKCFFYNNCIHFSLGHG